MQLYKFHRFHHKFVIQDRLRIYLKLHCSNIQILRYIYKNKLMLSGAVGYRYDYWRTELEYVWRDKNKFENDFFKRQFRTYSGMWNNYIDILPYEWISPYAGVGIGYTKLKYSAKDKFENTVIRSDKKTNFTWSLGAGVTVKVTNRINVDAGYRYYDIGSFGHEDVTLQEIYGGLRYVF